MGEKLYRIVIRLSDHRRLYAANGDPSGIARLPYDTATRVAELFRSGVMGVSPDQALWGRIDKVDDACGGTALQAVAAQLEPDGPQLTLGVEVAHAELVTKHNA